MTQLVAKHSGSFALINQGAAPSRLQINPREERITTVIAKTTALEGNFRFQEGVKIDGHIRGDVTFGLEDGLCIVGHGAVIEGNLRGPRALVLGEVQGNIEVETLLVLAPTAVVTGTVRSGRFLMYDGAAVSGSIETSPRKLESPHAAEKPELKQVVNNTAERPTMKLETAHVSEVRPLRKRWFGRSA